MARKKSISVALRKRNLENSKNQAVLKKGMELPVNTLVVVAIAVIVILAIAAFFMGGFGGSSQDMQNRQAFLNECSGWVQSGCNNDDYDDSIKDAFLVWQPNMKDEDNPSEISSDRLGGTDEKDYLASRCGCWGAGSGTRTSTTPDCPESPAGATNNIIGCLDKCSGEQTGADKKIYVLSVVSGYKCPSTKEVCCKATLKT